METNRSIFFLEQRIGIERKGITLTGIKYELTRIPKENDTDFIKISIDKSNSIIITDRQCYARIDINSIDIIRLKGKPNLFNIKWQTEPEGNGAYIYYFYIVFIENNPQNVLLEGVTSSGSAGMAGGSSGVSFSYQNNELVKLIKSKHGSTYESKESNKWVVEESLSKVYLKYIVVNNKLKLTNVRELLKKIKSEETGEELDELWNKAKWIETIIPIEEAQKKYPAINKMEIY